MEKDIVGILCWVIWILGISFHMIITISPEDDR